MAAAGAAAAQHPPGLWNYRHCRLLNLMSKTALNIVQRER
jgi:hypothetical protein